MKPALGKVFTLLLCLSLCMLLAPAALAEDAQGLPADTSGQELFPVRFYNGKGYDLIGLQVTDAVGHALDPSSREDGWTYLLAPGAYSYTYHDDRGIFLDLDKTGFTVDGAAEIPLTLRAFLTENANFTVFVNPFYQDTLDEDTIAWHEEALSEELDRVVAHLAADEEASGLSQSDVFYGSENEIAGYAATLRAALIAREPSVSLTVYSGNTRWNPDNYMSVLLEVYQKAFQHTGNQQEGDTLRWEVYSYGYGGGTYNNYDYNKQSYYHVIPYSFTYQSSAAQEAETAAEVERVVQSLSLNGKSDYEKFAAINEYLYMNVNYDYSYQKHSSYNALIERNSVCQGFATAFYRLSLAAGLDARVVSSSTMGHGWNIAKLGNHYYYLDATWDSNWREQNYPLSALPYFFIHGSDWWLANHIDNNNRSELGDEFGYTSNFLFYDPAFGTYVVSVVEYDPSTAGVAVNSTNFPDVAFRIYVSGVCDINGDGYLSDEEVMAVTAIVIEGKADSQGPISSLKGIEHFTALEYLLCEYNNLTDLDLSQNKSIKGVLCYGNKLKSLEISNLSSLNVLWCDSNQLEELDLRGDTSLESLGCSYNKLKKIYMPENSVLNIMRCYNNELSYLDISNCPILQEYVKSGTMTIDDDGYRHYKISDSKELVTDNGLMLTGGATEAYVNSAYFPDPAFRRYISHNLDVDHDNKLSEMEIMTTLSISCEKSGIEDLTGSEYFTSIVVLNCSGNELVELDVSANTKLAMLICYDNNLTSLNVSGCNLFELSCYNNELKTLDLSNCDAMFISCDNNNLTSLDVSRMTGLYQLSCSCNNLNSLLLSGCSSLSFLYCSGNNLSSLNITGCTVLSRLDCSGNALTNLDVSKNTMLQRLWCYDNKLSVLDVSQNSELLLLSCYNNSLSRLDVTGNTALRGLACQNNGLKALNISPCGVLTQLITDVNPEIEDGVVMYMDNTESDTFRWLLYDEAALLITPDMVPGFVLPAALTRIEDDAFTGIPNLITVYIPSTVTYIDPNAFGEADELYIFGQAGSAAETFAQGSSAYAFIPAA